jgi:hypothetical protein
VKEGKWLEKEKRGKGEKGKGRRESSCKGE